MIRYEIRGKQILPIIPKSIGHVGDNAVEVVQFKMARLFNSTDLSEGFPFVHAVGKSSGNRNTAALKKRLEGDSLLLEWTVEDRFTHEAETLEIQISIQGIDSVLWASNTAKCYVEPSLFPAKPAQATARASVALVSAVPFAARAPVAVANVLENGLDDHEKEPVTLDGRTMTIPEKSAKIGVRGDRNAETVSFLPDRYYDGQDFSVKTWFVEILNAANQYDICAAELKPTEEAGKLFLEWLVGPRHAIKHGKVNVRLRATEGDSFIWQSYTGVFEIADTFGEGEIPPEPGLSVTDQVLQALKTANHNLELAQTALDNSVEEADESAQRAAAAATAAEGSASDARNKADSVEATKKEIADMLDDLFFYQTAPPLSLLEKAVILTTPTLAIIENQIN